MLAGKFHFVILGMFVFTSVNGGYHGAADGHHHDGNDCKNERIDLQRELNLWEDPSLPWLEVEAAQNAEEVLSSGERGLIDKGHVTTVTLHNQNNVQFVVKPGGERPVPEGTTPSAGLFAFHIPFSYAPVVHRKVRISMDQRPWIDVVMNDYRETVRPLGNFQLIPSSNYAMQRGCPTIVKSVEYELLVGHTYILQISSAKNEEVNILMTYVK